MESAQLLAQHCARSCALGCKPRQSGPAARLSGFYVEQVRKKLRSVAIYQSMCITASECEEEAGSYRPEADIGKPTATGHKRTLAGDSYRPVEDVRLANKFMREIVREG